MEKHGGEVPDSMDLLLELPGVGRKTANLILGVLYGKPAIVADTHVIRLSNRFGLVNTEDAFKVEQTLRELVSPEESMVFCHRLVFHGRRVCKARNPDCQVCKLREVCAVYSEIKQALG
jgi:endonuclease-3